MGMPEVTFFIVHDHWRNGSRRPHIFPVIGVVIPTFLAAGADISHDTTQDGLNFSLELKDNPQGCRGFPKFSLVLCAHITFCLGPSGLLRRRLCEHKSGRYGTEGITPPEQSPGDRRKDTVECLAYCSETLPARGAVFRNSSWLHNVGRLAAEVETGVLPG